MKWLSDITGDRRELQSLLHEEFMSRLVYLFYNTHFSPRVIKYPQMQQWNENIDLNYKNPPVIDRAIQFGPTMNDFHENCSPGSTQWHKNSKEMITGFTLCYQSILSTYLYSVSSWSRQKSEKKQPNSELYIQLFTAMPFIPGSSAKVMISLDTRWPTLKVRLTATALFVTRCPPIRSLPLSSIKRCQWTMRDVFKPCRG